jgi:hypothetical protein
MSNSSAMFINLTITGLYNGILPGIIIIKTIDTNHNADIDSISIQNPLSYTPFILLFRPILEMNAIGIRNMQIILDNTIPYSIKANYTLKISVSNVNLANSSISVNSIYNNSLVAGNNRIIYLPTNQF